jgi:hypothetical protein
MTIVSNCWGFTGAQLIPVVQLWPHMVFWTLKTRNLNLNPNLILTYPCHAEPDCTIVCACRFYSWLSWLFIVQVCNTDCMHQKITPNPHNVVHPLWRTYTGFTGSEVYSFATHPSYKLLKRRLFGFKCGSKLKPIPMFAPGMRTFVCTNGHDCRMTRIRIVWIMPPYGRFVWRFHLCFAALLPSWGNRMYINYQWVNSCKMWIFYTQKQ